MVNGGLNPAGLVRHRLSEYGPLLSPQQLVRLLYSTELNAVDCIVCRFESLQLFQVLAKLQLDSRRDFVEMAQMLKLERDCSSSKVEKKQAEIYEAEANCNKLVIEPGLIYLLF